MEEQLDRFAEWLESNGTVIELNDDGNIIHGPREIVRWLWRKFIEWLRSL